MHRIANLENFIIQIVNFEIIILKNMSYNLQFFNRFTFIISCFMKSINRKFFFRVVLNDD